MVDLSTWQVVDELTFSTERIDPLLISVSEAVNVPVAFVASAGIVLAANDAWRTSSEFGGSCREGEDFVAWCKSLGAPFGRRLAAGVGCVLRGALPVYSDSARLHLDGMERHVQIAIHALGRGGKAPYLISRNATTEELLEDRLLSAQAQERERLAAELHDSVGQNLVCLGLGLTRLRRLAAKDAELAGVVADMSEALDHAHAEIRTLSFLLRPPWDDEPGGFVKAVGDLVAGFARRAGLHASTDLARAPPMICRGQELALFRVLQEALVNIHRHAQADNVEVSLACDGEKVTMKVRDDGVGISGGGGAPALGVGLLSMRERLRRLGGDLGLLSGSEGTVLTATLSI